MRDHQDQSPYLPVSGGPRGHNLYDAMIFHADGEPAPWEGGARPVDVLDHHALGYPYDTDPTEESKLSMGPVPAEEELPEEPQPPMPIPMPMPPGSTGMAAASVREPLPMFALESEIAALSGETREG